MNGVQLSRVMYNGKQVWPKIVTEIPLSDTKAGDVLLWDKINQRKLFTSSDNLSSYPSESYTPIGVVVIPASHDVYGDGSCGVMSLKPMNCNTPSTGGTYEQSMYWGEYGTDISALSNLNQVPTGNTSNGIPTGQTSYAYLPSDKFSGTQCAHDTDAFYYSSSYIPSPYLTDGSRNPGYYQTSSPSSSSNALADFDGIGNTEKIITQRGTKDYNSWTPGRITEADYPAASCCDMFHTEGTSQGDWYLPACGELGYIMPPFNKINQAIANMRQAHGSSVGLELNTGNYYWSSTEHSSDIARFVNTSNGRVYSFSKDNYCYVRAFLKVSSLDMSGTSPESASNGVYVYANNGKLYNPDNWDTANNDLAIGVAVVTDDCKFAITKGAKPQRAWSNAFFMTSPGYDNSAQAVTDFNGESNTASIREITSTENDSNNAAHYCYAQTITINDSTKHGYLAAAGEWQAAYDNKSAIGSAMSLIGGVAIPTGYDLWSSTEGGGTTAWTFSWNDGSLFNLDRFIPSRYAVPMYSLD